MRYYTSLINDDHQDQNPKRAPINGPRPSPLRISKDSHAVHKPSDHHHHHQNPTKHRRPVIIYTHSPKIIHTQARDFMALVQRLTGSQVGQRCRRGTAETERLPASSSDAKSDNDESTVTAEDIGSNANRPFNNLADIPLFTPSGMDLNFFCSPKPVAASAVSSSLSPSALEFMKGLPEY